MKYKDVLKLRWLSGRQNRVLRDFYILSDNLFDQEWIIYYKPDLRYIYGSFLFEYLFAKGKSDGMFNMRTPLV